MLTQALVVWPNLTAPKLIAVGDALNLLTGAMPLPPRLTVALVPVLPATLRVEANETARVGLKVISTGTAWPGWMIVPRLGNPRTENGSTGPRTVDTFSGEVPPLTMSTTCGSESPTGTFETVRPSFSTCSKTRL